MTYIPISTLNDFVFCPYSIYLHGIYSQVDFSLYHAAPQVRGSISHKATDSKTSSTRKDYILSLPVFSDNLRITGKIDLFRISEGHLIERKYQLKNIYQGHLYQIWGQYFCLKEMGYDVKRLSFYEISTKRFIPVSIPGESEFNELKMVIEKYIQYNPGKGTKTNQNKCSHCIYCPMCDKTDLENVY